MLMLHSLMLISSCYDNTSLLYSCSRKADWLRRRQLRLLGQSECACTVSVECTCTNPENKYGRPFLRCSIRPNFVLIRPCLGCSPYISYELLDLFQVDIFY